MGNQFPAIVLPLQVDADKTVLNPEVTQGPAVNVLRVVGPAITVRLVKLGEATALDLM